MNKISAFLKKPIFWQVCTAALGGYVVYTYWKGSSPIAIIETPTELPAVAEEDTPALAGMLRAVGYY